MNFPAVYEQIYYKIVYRFISFKSDGERHDNISPTPTVYLFVK